jgi:pyruvate/2-oxoglutarate dehydrogenase complex dihydrolipoamide acyltransferase (E2) component
MDALERIVVVGGQIVIRPMRYLALSTGSRNDHQQDNP